MPAARLIAAVAFLASAPGAAMADIRLQDVLAEAVKRAGEHGGAVKTATDQAGNPLVAGRFSGGARYAAFLYECDAAKALCRKMSLVVGFIEASATVADMNDWNNARYPQGFIDGDGDPVMQLFVFAPEPYGPRSIAPLLEFWENEAGLFREIAYVNGARKSVSAGAGEEAPVLQIAAPRAPAPAEKPDSAAVLYKNAR